MFNLERIINDLREARVNAPVMIRGLNTGGIDNQKIIEMVDNLGVTISGGARFFLESLDFKTSTKRQGQDMIKIRLRNLGIKGDNLTYSNIYKRANSWGFREYPMGTAVELFLHEIEEISDEPIFVATEPVYNKEKVPFIFRVDFRNRSIDLTNSSKFGGKGWTKDDEFMFVIPRETAESIRA